MSTPSTFRGLFDSVRDTLPYKVESLIIEFTEQVATKVKALGLSRREFAERIETSPAYVSKLLSGGTNFTLESMVKVAEALDCEMRVEMVSKASMTDWITMLEMSIPSERADQAIVAHWQRLNDTDETKRLIGARVCDFDVELDELLAKQT